MSKTREKYLDSIKLIAMLIICTSHYLIEANTQDIVPIVYRLINGKFGVSLFFVVSGYLSYKQGIENKESIVKYIARRYLYLVFCALIVNSAYYLLNIDDSRSIMNFGYVLGQSLFLGFDIFKTYWFAKDLLYGNIICYILSRHNIDFEALPLGLIFALINKPFIAICIFSVLINKIEENIRCLSKIRKSLFYLLILFLILVIIVFDESSFMYIIYGIVSVFLFR